MTLQAMIGRALLPARERARLARVAVADQGYGYDWFGLERGAVAAAAALSGLMLLRLRSRELRQKFVCWAVLRTLVSGADANEIGHAGKAL